MNLSEKVSNCIEKVKRCRDYDALYHLENDFNSVGFTMRETMGSRMALCRIVDGRPAKSAMFEDFIFIGLSSEPCQLLMDDVAQYVSEFIAEYADDSQIKVVDDRPTYRHVGLYGRPRTEIRDEDILNVMQRMGLDNTQINESNLLAAIKKWSEEADAEL